MILQSQKHVCWPSGPVTLESSVYLKYCMWLVNVRNISCQLYLILAMILASCSAEDFLMCQNVWVNSHGPDVEHLQLRITFFTPACHTEVSALLLFFFLFSSFLFECKLIEDIDWSGPSTLRSILCLSWMMIGVEKERYKTK